mgnify:FL=1
MIEDFFQIISFDLKFEKIPVLYDDLFLIVR